MADFLSSYRDALVVICASFILLAFIVGFMKGYTALKSLIKSYFDRL